MRRFVMVMVFALGCQGAQAAGCLSGAAVGAVGGHLAGHHALLGAAGGCIVGHEMRKHERRKQAEAAQQQGYGQSQ